MPDAKHAAFSLPRRSPFTSHRASASDDQAPACHPALICHPDRIRQGCGKDLNFNSSSKLVVAISLLLCLLVSATSALSEHTRTWRQGSYEDFLKGTPHGIAVRSDGRLELAPKFTLVADADASYLLSLRLDAKGALYAAGGSPAKVFRFDGNTQPAKPTIVFESTDLMAQAIAFDPKGTLYVATDRKSVV